MIISASRRTDIPAFYSQWFINRIHAGWCQVPNPLNYNQLSYVSLRPEDVDAIVFWSKNPYPMFSHLNELNTLGFRYYFHFTLNEYQTELEPDLPPLKERVRTFKTLSNKIGGKRVVWRYDPIIISNYTTHEFHLEKFSNIAKELSGFTNRVVISYVDFYQKTNRRLLQLNKEFGYEFDIEAVKSNTSWNLVKEISDIARSYNMDVFTCAEELNFSEAGAPPGKCIDGELLQELWKLHGHDKKDPAQRETCLCAVSKDIGINDTCVHGCTYCYSTRNLTLAKRRYSEHNPNSPVLWGKSRELSEEERTEQQKVRLL